MSKIKKIIFVISIISVFICSIGLSVSAESSYLPLKVDNTKIFTDIIDNPSITKFTDNSYRIEIPYHQDKSLFASIWEIKENIPDKLCNYHISMSFINLTPSNVYVTFNYIKYSVPISGSSYNFTVQNQKDILSKIRIESNYSFNSNLSGFVIVNFYYQLSTDNAIIDNQNQNTDKEIQAGKENTQAIIDNQNQIAEQEKNEIHQSGDEGIKGSENVPDKSDGFINSISKLVGALSYNGTECKWTLPQVKIPQIANIVPEKTLIEQQEIDFGVWVQKLPSNILKLIQALLTCALIVYCFKELYGTISYVLTLKGGGE